VRLQATLISEGKSYTIVITAAVDTPQLHTDYAAEFHYAVPATGVNHSSRGTVRFSAYTATHAEGSFAGPGAGGWITGSFRVSVGDVH
jgi:hypothetical protein